MLDVYVLRILLAYLILRKPAHTQRIKLNGIAKCICIACHVFTPGIHLSLWGYRGGQWEKSQAHA